MKYGNFIYNKIKIDMFVFSILGYFGFFKCICVLLMCVVFQFVILSAFIGFVVVFCIYEDILNIFLNIFETCPRSVNIFRTDFVFFIVCDILGFGGYNWAPPPPPPTPIHGVNVKVPFRGKNMVLQIIASSRFTNWVNDKISLTFSDFTQFLNACLNLLKTMCFNVAYSTTSLH